LYAQKVLILHVNENWKIKIKRLFTWW